MNRQQRRAAAKSRPQSDKVVLLGVPGLPAAFQPANDRYYDLCIKRMIALERAQAGHMDAGDFNDVVMLANVVSMLVKNYAQYQKEEIAQNVETVWDVLKSVRARRQQLIDAGKEPKYGLSGTEMTAVRSACVFLHNLLKTVPLARLGRAETAAFDFFERDAGHSYKQRETEVDLPAVG